MIETNAREFARHFPRFRAQAAAGQTVRIRAPDGTFLLVREPRGIAAGDFLNRLTAGPARGLFDEGGADAVEEGRRRAAPARSPWP